MDPNAHIWVFKKIIKMHGETYEKEINNLFGFTLQNVISKWEEFFEHIINIQNQYGNASHI
jgi:hypothetical protein